LFKKAVGLGLFFSVGLGLFLFGDFCLQLEFELVKSEVKLEQNDFELKDMQSFLNFLIWFKKIGQALTFASFC